MTGADGFIGSVVSPVLAERGFDAVGLDTGFYRAGCSTMMAATGRAR